MRRHSDSYQTSQCALLFLWHFLPGCIINTSCMQQILFLLPYTLGGKKASVFLCQSEKLHYIYLCGGKIDDDKKKKRFVFSARGIQLPAYFLRRLKLQLKNYIPFPDYLFKSHKSTFLKSMWPNVKLEDILIPLLPLENQYIVSMQNFSI